MSFGPDFAFVMVCFLASARHSFILSPPLSCPPSPVPIYHPCLLVFRLLAFSVLALNHRLVCTTSPMHKKHISHSHSPFSSPLRSPSSTVCFLLSFSLSFATFFISSLRFLLIFLSAPFLLQWSLFHNDWFITQNDRASIAIQPFGVLR